jgi:hypothetical protein
VEGRDGEFWGNKVVGVRKDDHRLVGFDDDG